MAFFELNRIFFPCYVDVSISVAFPVKPSDQVGYSYMWEGSTCVNAASTNSRLLLLASRKIQGGQIF